MFRQFATAAFIACVASTAAAHSKGHGHHHHHGSYGPTGDRIVVSCYRGPWKEVIWDKPNAIFVDTLVSVGYDFATAHAIAERVCRDRALVGNPDALKATMQRIWRDRASHRRHNY